MFLKAKFILTVSEIFLFESRSVLSPTQRATGSQGVKGMSTLQHNIGVTQSKNLSNLSKLENILSKSNFGLYWDDGPALLRNFNRQETEKVRKNIIRVFRDIGFSLEIETNLKEVDFLDTSLNLRNGTYRSYKKPNDRLLYIHSLSNHPPNVIKQISNSILERLSKNLPNEEIFNTAKCQYEDALKKSRFKVDFK